MDRRIIASPIGNLLLCAEDGRLCAIRRIGSGEEIMTFGYDPVLDEAQRQLGEYFAGERTAFSLPLEFSGTAFERALWQRLAQIPFGSVMTYGQLAASLGKPKASRAAGSACAKNPLLIVLPCHRVIAGTGRLTGFAAGMEAKRLLLAHEGWTIEHDRVKTESP